MIGVIRVILRISESVLLRLSTRHPECYKLQRTMYISERDEERG